MMPPKAHSTPGAGSWRTGWANRWVGWGKRRGPPTLNLREHLGLLTILVALPLIVVSFVVVARLAHSEREARRVFLLAANHSLSDAVEREIDKYFVVAHALSGLRSMQRGDLNRFSDASTDFLHGLPDASLVVTDPDGKPLADTLRPPEALSRLPDRAAIARKAFDAGAPFLSDLEFEEPSHEAVATVETPIFRNGAPLYELALTLAPRKLLALLADQKYPDGWIAAITDRRGAIVAQFPEGAGLPGVLTSPQYRAAIERDPDAVSDLVAPDGERIVSAHTRTSYGWTVSVGARAAALDAPLSKALWMLSLLGAGSLALSFALAYLASRRLNFGVRRLQGAAQDIGEGKPIDLESTGVREFDELSRAFAQASSLLREKASQQQAAETQLRTSEERFRLLADSLPQLVWTAGPDGRVDYANALRERYGKVSMDRTDWDGAIHPEDWRGTVEAWLRASEEGAPYEREHRLMVTGEGYRWHLSRAVALRDGAGKPVKWYGTTTDIHDHKMREQHVRVLMTEVDHRSKNLLAVVQAIARQTVSSTPTAGEFEKKFSARLLGLAASQHLLTEQQWSGVRLDSLVRSQISHYSDLTRRRIHIAGPDILLDSAATQALGMALHELTTNAAKYGALSNDVGEVTASWRIKAADGASILEMEWIERQGPAVVAPHNPGFGSTVIERMLAQRLDAEVSLSFEAHGLEWRLKVPLRNVESRDGLEEEVNAAAQVQ